MFPDVAMLNDLRELLKKDPRRQAVMAEIGGMHRVTYNAFLKDRGSIGIEQAERLAAAVGREVRLVDPQAETLARMASRVRRSPAAKKATAKPRRKTP